MMAKGKPRFESLDRYLANRDYGPALEAIAEEIRHHPENFNLLLRQAEILALAGEREKAIGVYRDLARRYAEQGFYARAIAVINKVVRLDPARQEVTRELARFIAAQQETEHAQRTRLERATGPAASEPPAAADPGASAGPAEKERVASRFFAEFPPAALEQLISTTAVRSFAAGETIVREGDRGASWFLIEEGEVEVQTTDPSGRHLVLARLGPGEFFGEVAVLTGKPRTATIEARSAVTLIEVSRHDLDQIAAAHPEVRSVLQRFYEKRAQATVEAVLARMRGGGA